MRKNSRKNHKNMWLLSSIRRLLGLEQPVTDVESAPSSFTNVLEEDQITPAFQNIKAPQEKETTQLQYLMQRLENGSVKDRKAAAEALGELGAAGKEALPSLVIGMADMDKGVRRAVAAALEQIEEGWMTNPLTQQAIPVLIKKTGSNFKEVERAAYRLLVDLGSVAAPALIKALGASEDEYLQIKVLQLLALLGEGAAGSKKRTLSLLQRKNVLVREAAIRTFVAIDAAEEDDIPALVEALADNQSAEVRWQVASILGVFGEKSAAAIPNLVQIMTDSMEAAREAAVDALAKIGAASITPMVKILENRNIDREEEWKKCINDLERIAKGIDLDAPINQRRKALHNASWYLVAAVDNLQRAKAARMSALRVLQRLGPQAAEAEPLLIEALKDEQPNVRIQASVTLASVSPNSKETLPALLRYLDHDQKSVRNKIIETLNKLDSDWVNSPQFIEILPGWIENLKKSGQPRELAKEVLRLVGGKVTIKPLCDALQNGDRVLRQEAAEMLGELGSESDEAIQALEKAMAEDPHAWVREAAEKARERLI